MLPTVFALIEKLVLSPVAQQAAWDIIRPYIQAGQEPPKRLVDLAHEEADAVNGMVKK